MHDPSGLIARIPELASLTRIPGLTRAVAGGDPHAVYRALWWAKRLSRVEGHGAVVDALLRNRRRFLRPNAQSPVLFTWNGIGFKLIDGWDVDASAGTVISTHFFVVLFVPVLPLAQYLVRRIDSESWSILGKVPLGALNAAWRTVVACFLAMGLVSVGSFALEEFRHATVQVVNGFDVPLQVSVGDEELTVPLRGHASVVVGTGELRLSARTEDGRQVDEATLNARPGRDLLLYDIAGAGPVLMRTVTYGRGDPKRTAPDASLCGGRTRDLDGIAHVFTTPPTSVRIPKDQKGVQRRIAELEEGGWRTCVQWMWTKSDASGAARIARLAVDLDPTMSFGDLHFAASAVSDGEGDEAARTWSAELLEAMPTNVSRHRVFQDLRRGTEEFETVVATYRERRDANPGSGDAAYLHARLLEGEPALVEAMRIHALHPDHALTARLAGTQLFDAERYAEAAPVLVRATELDEANVEELRSRILDALAALGQFEEALTHLPPPAKMTFEEGLRAERLHRRLGRRDTVDWPRANRAPSPEQRAWDVMLWQARLGDAVSEKELGSLKWRPARQSITIIQALGSAPDLAVATLRKSEPETPGLLDISSHILLSGELLRLGDEETLERLARHASEADRGFGPVVQFVREGEAAVLDSFSLEARAAAAFARSRMPGLPAAERRRWAEEARRSDVFQGVVTQALDSWPAPS